MFDQLITMIQSATLWAGYTTLGLFAVAVGRAFMDAEDRWGCFFTTHPGGPHHLSRYVLLFGTLILAARYLFAVIGSDPGTLAEKVKAAMQVYDWLDIDTLAGGSGAAYLMAKVTDGDILKLFGRK
ncbi:hypothetical protein DESC_740068 [Desulfosarcina cetonica]|uniref:hypothetical protein n=1 Tax=Desulfosarcina cetonica TaxID=90730 RepID=UPI0006D16A82|nr:hypothetical protein [Desulfosarcina cetonica]VTR69329.1 hypothetical protein DESC_740068 [Desulfosarcina cetonica]